MVAEEIDAGDSIKGSSLQLGDSVGDENNLKVSCLSDRVNDGNIDSKIRSIIFLRDGKIAFFQFAV